MPFQKIQHIAVGSLRLWSENPRDPFDGEKKNLEIIQHAVKHWNIKNFAKSMGSSFDLSEIPTVVKHGKKFVVYDGNRRVILAMIYHDRYKACRQYRFKIPDFPPKIPCNVCDQQTAFENVLRKHSESGSWSKLNKDIFVYKYLDEPKSPLMLLDELTGLISSSKWLNRRFIGEEVLKDSTLQRLGIRVENGQIVTKHELDDIAEILLTLANLHEGKVITTRENRSEDAIVHVLKKAAKDVFQKNENADYKVLIPSPDFVVNREPTLPPDDGKKNPKKTGPTKGEQRHLFGGTLVLDKGIINDLYWDIDATYNFYLASKSKLSATYPGIIRMALRLLAEAAGKEENLKMNKYIEKYFDQAKDLLDSNDRTFISNQAVDKNKIIQLLQTGAHNYKDSNNMEQTRAVSIVLGKILMLSHGKNIN